MCERVSAGCEIPVKVLWSASGIASNPAHALASSLIWPFQRRATGASTPAPSTRTPRPIGCPAWRFAGLVTLGCSRLNPPRCSRIAWIASSSSACGSGISPSRNTAASSRPKLQPTAILGCPLWLYCQTGIPLDCAISAS